MKRIVSAALALIMVFSMLTTVSAKTLYVATDFVPNPMELELGVEVLARESGTENEYTNTLAVTRLSTTEYGVDYKATLDMEPIRALLDEQFISVVLAADNQAMSEYNEGIIATTINVVIDYPAKALIKSGADINTAGELTAGNIFTEKSRTLSNNKLTITYVNKENLTVAELTANREEYLKNIAFELKDIMAFKAAGTHKVSVTLSGSTEVIFDTKTQVVNYVGGSSHILNYTEEVVQHVLTVVPLKPATCIAEGSTEGVICSTHNSYECGALGVRKPEVIKKLAHILFYVEKEDAKCNETGMLAHYTCSFCKQDFTDADATNFIAHEALIIPKTGAHNLITIAGAAATCTKEGLTDGKICKDCGVVTVRQETIPALGHDYVTIPGKAATCTETGLTEGKECDRCDIVSVSQQIIPAKGHNYGEWNQTKAPTEEETGSKERTCLNDCGEKEVVEIPKLVHTHVIRPEMDVITKPPTCTEKGEKQQYCACGEAVGAPVAIDAKGHVLSHIKAVPSTCSTEGIYEHYKCAVCSSTFRDAAGKHILKSVNAPKDKNNHGGNEVIISPVPATCTTRGLTEGKKCKACNTVTKAQELTGFAKHILVEVPEKPASCEENGIKVHMHCVHCNKDFDMDGKTETTLDDLTIPHTGHSYGDTEITTPPTEDAEGEGKQVCIHDDTHIRVIKIAKKAHEHNEIIEEIIEEATCSHPGKSRKVYACCHDVIEDNIVIPQKAHTPVLIPTVEPDCNNEGVAAHYQCSECKKLFDAADQTKEIKEPGKRDKKLHSFRVTKETDTEITKECIHCKEVVKIAKEKSSVAEVKDHGGFKDEKDQVREEKLKDAKVETQIKIEKRDDVSAKIYETLPENVAEEKVVLDIVVEKSTTHKDEHTEEEETEIERIPQTSDLVEIIITIPESLRTMVDFIIHRLHVDEEGIEHVEKLLTTPNEYGEYIEIADDKSTITMYVRRFSEYAIVGYETVVNPTITHSSSSAAIMKTVIFKANGGTAIDDMRVKTGEKIVAPVTTREGYVFDGWYTDMALTNKFDFDTAIVMSMTLYAKWIEEADIPVAPADFDKFVDLGGFEWAETAINYLASKDIIKGVTDTTYEPGIGIKRGDVALLMVRLFALTSDEAAVFEDVPTDLYYSDACRIGKAHGVLLGVNEDNTMFEPERTILREEMAALIVRSLVTMGHIDTPADTDISKYADAEKVEAYAVPYVAYLTRTGVVQGNPDGTFRPKDKITRAEAAQILYNLYKLDIEGLLD